MLCCVGGVWTLVSPPVPRSPRRSSTSRRHHTCRRRRSSSPSSRAGQTASLQGIRENRRGFVSSSTLPGRASPSGRGRWRRAGLESVCCRRRSTTATNRLQSRSVRRRCSRAAARARGARAAPTGCRPTRGTKGPAAEVFSRRHVVAASGGIVSAGRWPAGTALSDRRSQVKVRSGHTPSSERGPPRRCWQRVGRALRGFCRVYGSCSSLLRAYPLSVCYTQPPSCSV